jgi:signal transduction histidine kinase
MRQRLSGLLQDRRIQRVGDVVLALGLAITSVVPVLGGDPSWGHPVPLGVTLALLSTVPVAWRSRAPLSAAAVVLVGNAACVFAAAPMQAAFQPFVALVLVGYSVGSRAESRWSVWAAGGLAVAVLPVFVAAVRYGGQDPGNVIPSYVWLIAAWTVGRVVRGWRVKTVALEIANREIADQRELHVQAAVMVERGRVARELHDVIAHNVSMMVVQAGAAVRVLEGDQPDVRNALEVIAGTGRQTVDEMRRVLGVLRADDGPAALIPQPGLADLSRLVASVRESGLPVDLHIDGPTRALPQAMDLSAYRIVQEALTNTLKHAGPARAEVSLCYGTDYVELRITDTRARRRPAAAGPGTGHGLIGMRERVAMFGGDLDAMPTVNGFAVRARLPIDDVAPA